MIRVSEAIQQIENYCSPHSIVEKSIQKTLNLILAEDIISPVNMPPFKQSSADGYAFIHSNISNYSIAGEIQAGYSKNIDLKESEAVRIFTGAKVPDIADTVVMQEHTNVSNNLLTIKKIPSRLSNIRPLGEQIKSGEIALEKGTILNEAVIGFLAGLGIVKIKVFKQPEVSILITGNELQQPGKALKEGQVYDSNSIMLQLALQQLEIKKIKISKIKDTFKATKKAIKKHIVFSDIVLISGGISVGDYDFVKQGLEENGASEVFYKVNQKPGKPLWFGYKGKTLIFGLPGNPASGLTCFYLYVLPLLKAKLGYENHYLPRLKAKATNDIRNIHGKTLFLKGIVKNDKATSLTGQASSMLKSFAVCNALLEIPEDIDIIKKGEEITYIKLR